jgi:AraC family transcriptional regulator of arabinose operon
MYNRAERAFFMAGRVSFNVSFLAGVTQMRPEKPGRVDRPEGMDGWILNCTLDGAGLLRSPAGDFTAERGDLLLFPPVAPHLYGYAPQAGRWTHQWLYFFPKDAWLEWMGWPALPSGVLRLRLPSPKAFETASGLFGEAIALSESAHPRKLELAMNRVEELLLRCEEFNPQRLAEGVDERIETSRRQLESSFAKRQSLEKLAKAAHLSKSRYSHLFKRQTGEAPMEFLEAVRIRRAKELLFISSKTLPEVAEDCGFGNVFYFSRVFKKREGLPPGAFRASLARKGAAK